MRYDKKAEIYVVNNLPNGYGGFVEEVVLFDIVDIALTPLHFDTRSVGNVINTVASCKLFTRTALPTIVDHVIIDGVKYYPELHNDFGKIHMLSLRQDGRL